MMLPNMWKLSKKEMRIKALGMNIESLWIILYSTENLLVLVVITLYILCVNYGILSILRTFSVISSPLSNSKGTSDTLFFLVECTSCNIPAILVSSLPWDREYIPLPWENSPYCLVLQSWRIYTCVVLSTAVGKLYWCGRFVSAVSHFNCALPQNGECGYFYL